MNPVRCNRTCSCRLQKLAQRWLIFTLDIPFDSYSCILLVFRRWVLCRIQEVRDHQVAVPVRRGSSSSAWGSGCRLRAYAVRSTMPRTNFATVSPLAISSSAVRFAAAYRRGLSESLFRARCGGSSSRGPLSDARTSFMTGPCEKSKPPILPMAVSGLPVGKRSPISVVGTSSKNPTGPLGRGGPYRRFGGARGARVVGDNGGGHLSSISLLPPML